MLLFLLLGCSGTTKTSAEETGVEELESPSWNDISVLLEEYHSGSDVPAIGAARVQNGEITDLGTVGLRSSNSDVEVTDLDKWHIGSCSKAMTATLTGTLVDEGLLGWDSTLSELFPNLEIHPSYQSVTVEMLLSHTGGTWSSLTAHSSTWGSMVAGGDLVAIRASVVADVLSIEPEVTPGTEFLYSNTGYIIVGSALESLTNSSWEELMQEYLFEPLTMGSCGFGPPDLDGDLDQPWGHWNGQPVDPSTGNGDNPAALGPAGTVHCSLPDWGRFISEQLKTYRGESTLLSIPQSEQLFEVQLNSYAMGWAVLPRSWADGNAIHHSGSNTMNLAVVWASPALDEAYLTVSNAATEEAASILDQITGELIGLED